MKGSPKHGFFPGRVRCQTPEHGYDGGVYLGIVLSAGEEGQLIGRGEVGPNLLHLPKTLPFPPLCSPVLEPDLQDKAAVMGVRLSWKPDLGAAPVLPLTLCPGCSDNMSTYVFIIKKLLLGL